VTPYARDEWARIADPLRAPGTDDDPERPLLVRAGWLGALLGRLAELGYVGAYRVLDARHFGVPQRRRRVFIVALDARRGATADDAAEVLAVGTRCDRHPPTGRQARAGAAAGAGDGAGVAGALTGRYGKGINSTVDDGAVVVGPSPDSGGVRATDGLAGRVDDRVELAPTLTAPDTRHRVEDGRRQDGSRRDRIPVVVAALDTRRGGADDNEAQGGQLVAVGELADDPLLPDGLDSHRYRVIGNGVVAPVAEWIGARLAALMVRLAERER
jgi:DNA (cytosine-5)-methyltransferase 1